MFEVHVVNGDGDRVFGPFAHMADAATEKERWQATGGCSVIEIRPVKGPTASSEAVTPQPVIKRSKK